MARMKEFEIILAAITSVILFIFGLENFSKELQKITGEKFRSFLGKATKMPVVGVFLGAAITAVIQSSSATSVIAIGLVNAGVLSFKNSIGIIFGSNVGTTVTAQLVAFKLTAFAPVFIILGFALSVIRSKYSLFAKSLFYFGFVFFSLNLISATLEPFKDSPEVVQFLVQPQNIFVAIFAGFLVTAAVQSSSVTTGLAVVLTQQGLLSAENAIPILMGANLGTTTTALIAIVNMDVSAKKTALSHFFFNLGGVLLFLPAVVLYKPELAALSSDPAVSLAAFHLLFNAGTTLVFTLAITPFAALVDRIMGEGKMDFERLDMDFYKKELPFEEVKTRLAENLRPFFVFLRENFSLAALSFEPDYKSAYEAAKKRSAYFEYAQKETQAYFSKLAARLEDENEVSELVRLTASYEYLFQIHDSVQNIVEVKTSMEENFVFIQADLTVLIRELSGEAISFFNFLSKEDLTPRERQDVKTRGQELQKEINSFNKEILKIMAQPERKDAGFILHFVTHTQRLKDKLLNYHKMISAL